MHTYLHLNADDKARAREIDAEATRLGVSPFDRISPAAEGSSIGIAEIRAFIKRLTLAPVEGAYAAGIIVNAETLTQEAQQALLKTLEEPPEHAYIFLGAANDLQLIPTIISRCIIVSHAIHQSGIPDAEQAAITILINEILSASPGKKIHLVSSIGKTKEEIESWINNALLCLRSDLLRSGTPTGQAASAARKTRLIHRLFEAKKYLSGNVNPLLLLEHAVL
ncbi:hypothetical protein HZB58_02565 [Candidatus Gottesmanbacteria bacterium]|nr:hypothetical protein [Candidatus Gottesmanbacteria bacterium]